MVFLLNFLLGTAHAQRTDDPAVIESMRATLYLVAADGSTSMVDGNLTNYNDMFSNDVCGDDALKMNNFGENFGILRNGTRLAVEQRKKITVSDTTYFVMWNMQRQNYRMVITTDQMNQPYRKAYMEDVFARSTTILNLNGVTEYNFTVTGDPISYASNRFRVVFHSTRRPTLPVSINDVLLFRNGQSVTVQWTVENEAEMNDYEVEMSTDGKNFYGIQHVAPYNNNDKLSYSVRQNLSKEGEYHFRIRGISNSGDVVYSKNAKINLDNESNSISVYPNPVVNRQAKLHTSNLQSGKYLFYLVNSGGNKVMLSALQLSGMAEVHTLQLPANTQPGIYRLQVICPDGKTIVKTLHVL